MLLLGDCNHWLKEIKDNSIDLTVTSPPYDNLRTYGGHSLDFEAIAKELYRVTKDGGVVVWVVGDATVDGSETLTSFKQALYFRKIGFNIHDTMIYAKSGFSKPATNRYHQTFEYMFILSKGRPKTFNPLVDRRNRNAGSRATAYSIRESDGRLSTRENITEITRYGMRFNIWTYDTGFSHITDDIYIHNDVKINHPAIMHEQLALDHIKSWSNEGDLILDPFAGSGTTLKAAHQLNRKWIGIEINPEYVALAKKRLTPYIQQQRLETFLTRRNNMPYLKSREYLDSIKGYLDETF